MKEIRTYRGISKRLAIHYLENLGGEQISSSLIEGDEWTAQLEAYQVSPAGSITLTEVKITFSGDEPVLGSLIDQFSQKAMRAGG